MGPVGTLHKLGQEGGRGTGSPVSGTRCTLGGVDDVSKGRIGDLVHVISTQGHSPHLVPCHVTTLPEEIEKIENTKLENRFFNTLAKIP